MSVMVIDTALQYHTHCSVNPSSDEKIPGCLVNEVYFGVVAKGKQA
jgi:hypothetical protein